MGFERKILATTSWQKQTSHSEIVTHAIEELLETAKVRLDDLQFLICSHGPGSFTGLRVGLSVVRSLAYSYQIPIVAINDCMSIAINTLSDPTIPVLVVLDAQKNKIFAATYEREQNKIREVLSPRLIDPLDLGSHLPKPAYSLTGDGARFFPLLSESVQKKIDPSSVTTVTPEASALYEYVVKNESQFKKQTWDELLPLYLRASAAEEVAAEKQGKKS